MSKTVELKFRNTIDVSKLYAVSKNAFLMGQKKASIQMLDWMSTGTGVSQAAPPIRTGILESSGSVFYKNKLLKITPDVRIDKTKGEPTPLKNYNSKNITWGFNTDYATRMHEDKDLNPGLYSIRNANRHPGNQWMLEHLKKDENNYSALIAKFAGKYL